MVQQQTPGSAQRPLRGIAEIRHFFRTNTTPIFFLGATPFNLLGLDRWVEHSSRLDRGQQRTPMANS